MPWLDVLGRRVGLWLRRERFERELKEEMRQHLALKAQEHVSQGMDPASARYAAQRSFGNAASIAERTREVSGGPLARRSRGRQPLLPPHAGPESRVRGNRDPVARPRDRRQQRHLQPPRSHRPRAAAGRASGGARHGREHHPRPRRQHVLVRSLPHAAREGLRLAGLLAAGERENRRIHEHGQVGRSGGNSSPETTSPCWESGRSSGG